MQQLHAPGALDVGGVVDDRLPPGDRGPDLGQDLLLDLGPVALLLLAAVELLADGVGGDDLGLRALLGAVVGQSLGEVRFAAAGRADEEVAG